MIDIRIKCQYCGKEPVFCDSKVIYGKSYGMVYLCKPCDAYVGVHNGSRKPLGILANKELRKWKNKAHAAFDPIWQSKKMGRREAYKWLAEKLELNINDCHIGMFNIEFCQKVILACT